MFNLGNMKVAPTKMKRAKAKDQSKMKAPNHKRDRRKDNVEPTKHFASGNSLNNKLSPGYTAPSITMNNVNYSQALNSLKPSCFFNRKLTTSTSKKP